MDLQKIQKFAQHQSDNWIETDGVIESFDPINGVLVVKESKSKENYEFTMNDNAASQVYERLNLKGTYSDWVNDNLPNWKRDSGMMQDAIDKRIDQMADNTRLSETRVIYDVNTNQAKAVKTSKYVRLKNLGVLNAVINKYEDNFDVNHSYINDNKMSIVMSNIDEVSITKDGIAKDRQVGDIIGVGSETSNSEVGRGAVVVSQFNTRLACTNGMTSKQYIDLFRFRHVYDDLMKKLDTALEKIINPDKLVGIISSAMKRPAKIETIEDFHKIVSVPKRHHEGIIVAHQQEPVGVTPEGINGWGIYNAFTRYASRIFPTMETYTEQEAHEIMGIAYPLLTV